MKTFALVVMGLLALAGCSSGGSVEGEAPETDEQIPTDESAEVLDTAPIPVAPDVASDADADADASPAAEPDFMTVCLASMAAVNDATIMQCHGLQVSWRISQEHTQFMDECMPAIADVTMCQAFYTLWLAR